MKILTRILLIFLSVLFTVLLTVTTLSSSLISCVRAHFTPEYIYNSMNSLDYASLEIPDENGNEVPLCDIINDQVRDFGIYFTEDDLNGLIHAFSIDAIITSYVQDVRTWALDDGPVPVLDADEVAETVLMGLDDSLYMFLSMFGDPQEALSNAVSGLVSAADLNDVFEGFEIVQKILSFDSMIFIISVSASLFLMILIVNKLKLVPTAVYTGISCILSGSVMLFLSEYLDLIMIQYLGSSFTETVPQTLFYRIYYPFMDTIHRTGTFIALGGLAAVIVFAVIGSFAAMIAHEKAASRAYAGRGQNGQGTPYAQFNYSAPDYMAQNFQADGNENTAAQAADKDESDKDPSGEDHNDTDY